MDCNERRFLAITSLTRGSELGCLPDDGWEAGSDCKGVGEGGREDTGDECPE